MNILIDELPEAIEVDGVAYPLNTDFRSGIQCILDFEDQDITDDEKAVLLLRRLYKGAMPDNVNEAVRLAVKFLDGGKEDDAENPFGERHRLYSFEKDASLIYAAFQQTHGIDLQSANLHWWQFLALFMDLGADTAFNSLVNLRRRVKNGDASKEEREQALKMGAVFDLPEYHEYMNFEENESAALFTLLSEEGQR